MKTLTVRLPDSLLTEIEQESRTRRISKSDVVRDRLCHKPHGLRGTNSREVIRKVLEKSWAAKVPVHTPRFSSSNKQRLAEIIRAKKLHR